jgi:signal transduction histidine kinase
MRLRFRAAPASGQAPLSQLLSGVAGGYYWQETGTGREECSGRLRQLLGLKDYDSNLAALLDSLGEAHATIINQAIAGLPQGKGPTLLTMNLKGGMAQLECTVSGAYDAGGKLTHVILWFTDTSASHKQQGRMVKENGQLKRDVKQFSSILNVLPVPVWLRAADGAIRYCNMAYSEAAEESPERRAEHEMLELHPQSRALAKAALDSGEMQTERRHIIIGGARKLYQFTEIPLKSDGIIVGIAQDATELENVQADLARYIDAQSELLESVTSAMAVFGADMRLKFYNYAYVRLWGFDEHWLDTGPSYSELLEELRDKRRLPEQANFPQFKQRHLKMFTDLIEPREEIFYLPDGRTLRVLAIPHALSGILFAYEDVTDRLALERSYNTLTAVQKATLDNLHEGVVVFGEDGRLRLTNPRFLKLWKLEKSVLSPETHIADLIEKTRALHNAPEWEPYKQNFIAQMLVREVQARRMERTDGSVIDSVVVPLPDGATLITFSDVTDSTVVERSLRERNEALQEADRLKTEFLANVSYELRSPLTSISGFSEMLTQDYFGKLTPKQREYVGGIHSASQHLMHLINDILDIASIEAGYMKLDVSEFDIYAMLQSVVALVSERMREHKIGFTLNCPRRIGKILADESRLKQIMFNLLSNAIKYSEAGGKILLSTEAVKPAGDEREEIRLTVEDHGIGISPEEQQAVFGVFYRGTGTGAGGRRSGAGLGLSMVKSFIELHGGRVELFSKPGEGTRIVCTLERRNQRLLDHAAPVKAAS